MLKHYTKSNHIHSVSFIEFIVDGQHTPRGNDNGDRNYKERATQRTIEVHMHEINNNIDINMYSAQWVTRPSARYKTAQQHTHNDTMEIDTIERIVKHNNADGIV